VYVRDLHGRVRRAKARRAQDRRRRWSVPADRRGRGDHGPSPKGWVPSSNAHRPRTVRAHPGLVVLTLEDGLPALRTLSALPNQRPESLEARNFTRVRAANDSSFAIHRNLGTTRAPPDLQAAFASWPPEEPSDSLTSLPRACATADLNALHGEARSHKLDRPVAR
jgi:hypothetical protein